MHHSALPGAADARESARLFRQGSFGYRQGGERRYRNAEHDYRRGYDEGWNAAWQIAYDRNVANWCPERI
ncbi:hypothetical protein [Geodermatophilus ruber]|uniref:Uncharacterized protein n=1 Tax=Geodermatophilus ruber TaxID=504800 RepID=A0A1I3ZI78_9ACTN|nr:hypothetical protein [Geodermatophilus ruber]SFK43259.1 hypothetical protein SAMN04488085_101538 [Geodermatophilus ruber]